MISGAIRVLIVEDDDDVYGQLLRQLRASRTVVFDANRATTAETAVSCLLRETYDVCLLDHDLRVGSAIAALAEVRRAGCTIPIVIVTESDDDTVVAEALATGATNYLVRGELEENALERALRYACEHHQLEQAIRGRARQEIDVRNRLVSHTSLELLVPTAEIDRSLASLVSGSAGRLNPEQDVYLRRAIRNVRQLERLIDDLLTGTQAESGELELETAPIAFDEIIDASVKSLEPDAAAKRIHVELHRDPDIPPILADAAKLGRVVRSLVENAIKFTPEGGDVDIAVVNAAGEEVRLVVADSGPGMPPDVAERIFDRLFQHDDATVDTSRSGLGLGLFLSREVVRLHGGSITVATDPGKGSRFTVSLPLMSRQSPHRG